MRKLISLCLFCLLAMTACTSIDCPFNHTVATTYLLKGEVDTLTDTLTITTKRLDGLDTVLLNRSVKTDSFSLPMSYVRAEDVLVFTLTDTTNTVTRDTVWVSKTNRPHFESVDCALSYFHTITGVKSTNHAIDSIIIKNTEVTYDASKGHFHIYFKSGH